MNELSQCGASEPFALRVIGDDMTPEFCDGNIVVVDPGGLVKNGSYVIVKLAEETVLRQLRADNNRYYIYCNRPESEQEIGLHGIIGVVSQKAGRRRKDRKRYDI